jgi:mannosyl-oligosaccharide alpha-1,2-mannosidase
VGTLVLEWTHLSDLTGDETYGSLTQKAESYLLSPLPASSEPWPGLVGTNINITTGRFVDAEGGWNGGDDSFYEYLIKVSSHHHAKILCRRFRTRSLSVITSQLTTRDKEDENDRNSCTC